MDHSIPDVGHRSLRSSLPLFALSLATSFGVAQHDPDPANAVSTLGTPIQQEATGPALAGAHGTAGAQSGARDLTMVPIHGGAADQGYEYGVWGSGPGYKMSFHDGATLVPYLGRDYPHNQPLRWRTLSVTVGDRQLVTKAPRLSYAGLTAEYDLGEVVERYELRPEGAEQTFVLAQSRGAGDLVVRGAIDSMLHTAAMAAVHGDVRFFDAAGRHIATYGAATAVDANGRRRAMTTAVEGDQITLRLDAGWLEEATFPVVVDPLLGPGTQWNGGVRAEMDVLRDSEGQSNSLWLAYSYHASGTDFDLVMRRMNDDGTGGDVVFADQTTNWASNRPSLAYVAGADRAVVFFDRTFPSGSRLLRYHTHDRADLVLNTDWSSIPTSGNAWRVDVGGTALNGSGNQALVVWQQEDNGGAFQETASSDVFGCLVDVSNNSHGTPFVIANGALVDNERPSVNQVSTGSTQNTWLVAYQTVTTLVVGGGDDWDIAVKEVGLDASVSAPTYVDNGSSDHKYSPMIEGQNGRYLVLFVASPNTGTIPYSDAGNAVRVARLDWPAQSGVGSQPHGTVELESYVDPRMAPAGLGFDRQTRSHWALSFHSNVTEAIYMRVVGYRGELVGYDVLFYQQGASTVPGGIAFDSTGPQFVLAYGVSDGAADYSTVDRYAYNPAPAPATAGASCSPASIQWLGSQQIGAQLSGVRVNGAAVDSLHLCVLALAPASVQLFGIAPIQDGCWLLVPPNGPDHMGIMDLRIGALAEWNLPLPEFVPQCTLYFQDFHTVGNGGPFELQATQRLEVPIVRG